MMMAAKATPRLNYSFKAPSSSKFQSKIRRGSQLAYPAVTIQQQARIHRLIEDQGIVLMPGCYDAALSAAIVQKSGFSAGFISGYALSASLLGKSDFGLLTWGPSNIYLFNFRSFSSSNLYIYIFFWLCLGPQKWRLQRGQFAAPMIPIIADAGIFIIPYLK